ITEESSTVCIPLRAHENWEYRPERLKTLLTIICFFTVVFINHLVLAVISDIISRIPLPDLAHSLIEQYDTPRHLADLFASAAVAVLLLVCSVFHKYRLVAISSCIIAMFCIVISRIHYSVDVVMGYWISSIIFSVYHGFCEVPHVLRPRNRAFRRLFLFWTMFELERHVPEGRIPNKLEWPFPWPKAFAERFEEWNEQSNDTSAGRIARWLSEHRIKLHF
ncbi:hypothetical protein Angca_007877, partial [Angiostrongylus cantonensis]